MTRRRVATVGLVLLGLVACGALALLAPLRPVRSISAPQPAAGYDAARARLEALGNDDTCSVAPECRTIVLAHGARVRHVVVLFHGLTNCPAQFDSLGRLLYARGANVVIPVLPRHGCADRRTTALADLTSPELRVFTERILDAAASLGDSLTVAGLSVGGVLVAWAAQERPDVTRAVAIAPMFGLALAPGSLSNAVARVYRATPNRFQWWDPRVREKLPGPTHVYPRWSTRAIGEVLWLGASVENAARQRAPACRSIALVLVPGDLAIDDRRAAAVAEAWRAHGASVETFVFPESLRLNHDIVDPEQVGANPRVVYPRLLDLILPGPPRAS